MHQEQSLLVKQLGELCDSFYHDVALAIFDKMSHKVPQVVLQAMTVLDACVSNCGKPFHKEMASQFFTDALKEFIYSCKHMTLNKKMRYFVRKWAEEFKDDPDLSYFVSFYYFQRGEGIEFPDTDESESGTKKKKAETVSKDPNVVSSQQEADDIAKAIEASLKEEQKRKGTPVTSLYPMGDLTSAPVSNAPVTYASIDVGRSSAKKQVKALYDFEAAEDNELTFKAGDIIAILDDSDANWWKGEGPRGMGLFPSNFVSSDLNVKLEGEEFGASVEEEEAASSSAVTFNENVDVKEINSHEPVLAVNEELIDKTLLALQSTDPESQAEDLPQLLHDEESCKQMEKLIDRELEAIDRKHLEVTMLNEKILESLKMYDSLMKEMPAYMSTPYLKNPQYHDMGAPGAMGGQVMGGHPMQMSHPNMMPPQQQYMSYPPQSTNGYIPPTAMPDATPAAAPGPSAGANQQPTSSNALPTTYNSIYTPHTMPHTQQYSMPTSSDSSQPPAMPQQPAGNFMPYNPSTQPSVGLPDWRQTWSQYPGADPNSSNQPAISQYMDPNLTSTPYSTNQAASTPLM
jgi:signal transducing adaptor molecule